MPNDKPERREPRFGFDPDENIYFDRDRPVCAPFDGEEQQYEEACITDIIDAFDALAAKLAEANEAALVNFESHNNVLTHLEESNHALAEARRDTERLDWLGDQHGSPVTSQGEPVGCLHRIMVPTNMDLRAALDAAREGGGDE